MARNGMRLTNPYAGSTVCAPSRACLLTGKHTGHVHQRFNGNVEFRDDPNDATVASRLQAAGYRTAMIGKSGLSCNSTNGHLPNQKGFDHFFGFNSHQKAHRYYPPMLWRNGEQVFYEGNQGFEGTHYSGDLFMAETLAFLDAATDQPFFLHLSLQQPHADLNAPDKWKQPFLGKFKERPHKEGYYRSETHPRATYAGMVTYLDDAVGQVIQKLNSLGLSEKTLVIFSSDNGPMSEGGGNKNAFQSGGPLRGGKRDLYEGGIRVPTIACWPGTIQAGAVSDHPSAFWDFMPTACELAGVEPPADGGGLSYLPTLLGKTQAKHPYLYWEFYERGGAQAVRRGKWKGVRRNVRKQREGPIELYNLEEDLAEANNVAEAHPEIVAQITQLMREAHTPSELVSFTSP